MRIAATALLLLVTVPLRGCDRTPRLYDAACAVPLSHWGTGKDGIGHLRPVMVISVDQNGAAKWAFRSYETVMSDEKIRRFMSWADEANPQPQIVLDASPSAPCERVETIRRKMDASPICKGPHSLCSEGRNWKDWPLVGGP
jgi:hypothetical protein